MVSVLLRHEVKGLTNKLYTYALARKKTGLHAKCQVHSVLNPCKRAFFYMYMYIPRSIFFAARSITRYLPGN